MRLLLSFASMAIVAFAATPASAQTVPPVEYSAAQRMSEPGPEQKRLEQRVGIWNVVATMWPAPGAEPATRSVP